MRFLVPVLTALFLTACASAEGPGSLDTLSPAAQQHGQVQTAPGPAGVQSQALGAPGSLQPGSLQPGSLQSGTLRPGTLQTSPQQLGGPQPIAGQTQTLQDFSTIEPRPLPGNDPFATQPGSLGPLPSNQHQTLAQAVQNGVQQPPTTELLQPPQPRFPRVSLAPISTAPEPQATQLFDAIDDASFDGGMQLAFFGDETAQYVVRSQVSAIPADQVTSVLYVFDVYDSRGTLRHRVSGARSIPRSGPDGWSLVDMTTVQLIGEEVANRLLSWFGQNPS